MRFNANTSATIKRLQTYSGNKASYAEVAVVTVRGFLNPVAASFQTQSFNIFGQAYEFTTDGYKDIRVNDVLVINAEEYHVKGVARSSYGAIDIIKVTMEKPSKD